MKMVLRLLVFGFLLNAMTGLVIHYIPELKATPENLNGLFYNESDTNAFVTEFNSTIDSTSAATDTSNLIDNILDKLNLGIINKLQIWAKQWMFGFVEVIGKSVLRLDEFTINMIELFITLGYVLAFISLFSGKDIGYG